MFIAFFMNFIFLGHTINLWVSIQKIYIDKKNTNNMKYCFVHLCK